VVRLLGRGGMGSVFEAEQENPRRRVAVKVLSIGLGAPEHLQRFRQEAELLGRLHHPGIAHVYEAGTTELGGASGPYFAMELVEGATLLEHARHAELELEARLALLVQVCEAVQHAHEAGILHRDLKPSNVVVDGGGRAKVLDFGVARLLEPADAAGRAVTATGLIVGTLASMSPEQVSASSAGLDPRSDVYALGVLGYELVTGRAPLDVAELPLPQAARLICEQDPPLAGRFDRRLRGDVETILAKAMSKDRAQRYESARALADDVRRYLRREPIMARPASTFYHLRMFARRNRAFVAGLVVAALALVALTVAGLWFGWRESELRTRAEHAAYRGNVVAAGLALEQGNERHARELLDEVEGLAAGWEWHRLRRATEPWVASTKLELRFVWQARFLDGGPEAVAIGDKGGVVVWNPESGARSVSLAADPARAKPLALSADGRTVLSAPGGELVLWDATTGTVRARRAAPPLLVRDPRGTAALSPDGRHCAVNTDERGLVVIDWTGDGAETWLGEAGHPAFAGDGSLLVTTSSRSVALWSADGHALGRIPGKVQSRAIAVDATGARIAFVDEDRHVHVLERAPASDLTLPEKLPDPPTSLAFSPDGLRLAAMLDDGSLWVWDVASARLLERFGVGRSSWKTSLSWSADGARLLTAAHTNSLVRLWSLAEGSSGEALRGHASYVYPLAYSPDGTRIVSGGWDDALRIWSSATGELLATLDSDSGRVQTLALSPDGLRIVGGTGGGALIAWDSRTGAELARVRGAATWMCVAFAPDGATLAAANEAEPGRVRLLDPVTLATRDFLEEPEAQRWPLSALAFEPSGAFLVAGSRRLVRWDLAAGVVRAELAGLPIVRALAFAPGGEQLAVAGDGSLLALCDARTLVKHRELAGHAREVFAAAFAPDGTRLFSGGRDGLLRVWDARSGDPLGEFAGHRDYVWSVAVSPDGARVATSSGDFDVRQWESEPASTTHLRRREAVARAERVRPRVAALLARGLPPLEVAERLEHDPELTPELRRAALDELLRASCAGP